MEMREKETRRKANTKRERERENFVTVENFV